MLDVRWTEKPILQYIYENIFSIWGVYNDTPTQYNVLMSNALQRYVERQTTIIRHNTCILGNEQMYKIYDIQITEWYDVQKLRTCNIYENI